MGPISARYYTPSDAVSHMIYDTHIQPVAGSNQLESGFLLALNLADRKKEWSSVHSVNDNLLEGMGRAKISSKLAFYLDYSLHC